MQKGSASKDPLSTSFYIYVTLIVLVTGVLTFPALSVAWAVMVWLLPTFKLTVIDQLPPEPRAAVWKAPELTLT